MACLTLPLRLVGGAWLVAALVSCFLAAPGAYAQSGAVDSLYAAAIEADREGDDVRALALYTEVVTRDSAHVDAYFYRSAVFARQHNYAGAIQDLGHVQRLAPWFAGGFGNQGWYLIMAGRFADSRAPTRRAIELDSTAYYWPLNLGHAFLLDGDATGAEQQYAGAIRRINSRVELGSALADFDLFIEQDWSPDASRFYKTWLQTRFDEWESDVVVYRQAADSLFAVAESMFQSQEYSDAYAVFLESAEIENQSATPRSDHVMASWTKAGLTLYLQGLYDEALGPLQQALAVAEESAGPVDAGAIWSLIGGAHRQAQRFAESVAAYERSVALLEEAGDAVPEADLAFAMTQLAVVYSRTAAYRLAIDYYGRVLAIRERLNDTAQIIDALYGLGVAHYAVGEYETSIAYLERAVELTGDDNVTSSASMLLIIGSAYRDWNRLDEAIATYKQTILLYESIGDEASVASVANTLGSALQTMAQYDEAIEWHNRALDIHQRRDNSSDVALTFNKLGRAYHAKGNNQLALRYFRSALAVAEQLGQEDAVAANLSGIGVTYTALGRYDDSHEALLRALALHERLGNTNEVSMMLNNLGALFRAWGRFGEAIDYLERAAAIFEEADAEIELARALANLGVAYQEWSRYADSITSLERAWQMLKTLGRDAEASRVRGNMGETYRAQGRYEEALVALREYLAVQDQLGNDTGVAQALNNIGVVFRDQVRYAEALASYERALALIENKGLVAQTATIFNNRGDVYSAQGRYDEALASHRRALQIDELLGRTAHVVTRLNNIGAVYRDWGRFDDALESYRRALDKAEELNLEMETSVVLNNIGIVYDNWGRHEEALDYYRRGLAINEGLGRQAGVAVSLNNIGAALRKLSRHAEALEYYQRALELDEQLGREGNIATDLNNIGLAHNALGQTEESIVAFGRALEIAERLGEDATAATILYNTGTVYHGQGQYPDAVTALNRSVELHERLRLTAPGAARRDYLDDQIGAYRYLISAYVRNGQIEDAFASIEGSRGRMLAERLAGESTVDNVVTISSVQQDLDDDTAVLLYANSGSLFSITALLITRESSSAIEIAEGELLEYAMETYRPALDSAIVRSQRQSTVRREAVGLEAGALGEQSDFDVLVQYYRELLTSVTTSSRGAEGVRSPDEKKRAEHLADLSGRLYQLLIQPFEERLAGKAKLLVVPDEALGLVPFETLTDGEGRFLAEQFDVRYVQSLSVLRLLHDRTYDEPREGLIAFGGAEYSGSGGGESGGGESGGGGGDIDSSNDTGDETASLDAVRRAAYASIDAGGSQESSYAALGYDVWDDLPGSLGEVEALAIRFDGARVLTGSDVTESRVKQLSASGDLDNYAVVHFATHGLVVPELPELSALVLSMDADENEDGYLRMQEIAALDLRADFVNLSACETGLGRQYGGEGVVGLAQAFVEAGANGLSVSLWQVSDLSTQIFMEEVYRYASDDGLSYADAIALVKRGFINGTYGDEWRAPFYWAPFVYYGR